MQPTLPPTDGIYLTGQRTDPDPMYALVVEATNDLWARVEPMAEDSGVSESELVRLLLAEECMLSLRDPAAYAARTRARLVHVFGEGEELEARMHDRFGPPIGRVSPPAPDHTHTSNADLFDLLEDGEAIENEYRGVEDKETPQTPYDRIVTLAALRGMTRSQLAEKAGITKETLYNLHKHTTKWLAGAKVTAPPGVREKNLLLLSTALDTNPTWILTGEDKEDPIEREQERALLLRALTYERTHDRSAAAPAEPRPLNDLEKRAEYLLNIAVPGASMISWNNFVQRGRLALARGRLHPRQVDTICRLFGCSREWLVRGVGEAPPEEIVKTAWALCS